MIRVHGNHGLAVVGEDFDKVFVNVGEKFHVLACRQVKAIEFDPRQAKSASRAGCVHQVTSRLPTIWVTDTSLFP